MRSLIIATPPGAMAVVLFVMFLAISTAARRLVVRRFKDDAHQELADQANNLLTGVSATFAFFIGFAISMCWGAVTAGQSAVEQQSAAIQQMAWDLRNVPDRAVSAALTDKLKIYAATAAEQDAGFLARGTTANLPSADALEGFEDALNAYTYGPGADAKGTSNLRAAASNLVSTAAGVSAVANRAIPRHLVILLSMVAVVVTIILGITTVTSGRSSMIFIYIWCLIPALSLTVVLALAYPFALRSGITLAPLRAVAHGIGAI